ncbi:hypothetical protein [uncultured Oscillibacter sp.]|uniref:hypothetical protein n=1 Tax=uncultured Oscillibacter sp. TaxID=876091 RepID=UPI0026315968|nr:hypothetical protein [uncultured Oscillibacter sp.]
MKFNRVIGIVVKYILLTGGGVLLYILAAKYALAERGYFAVGGEVFFLLLPVLYYVTAMVIRDYLRDIKDRKKH